MTSDEPLAGPGSQRLDKWLWYARVAKSRSLAAALITAGKVRVNRNRVLKPSQLVKAGDVITAGAHRNIRILRVKAPGVRRGPPREALALYEELTPSSERPRSADRESAMGEPWAAGELASGARQPGSGRPTKRDRRLTDLLKGREPAG